MPKKFSFRLEPVLSLRSHKVKEEKEVFLQAQAHRLNKEKEIADANEHLNSLYREKTGKMSIIEIQTDFYRQNYIKEEIARFEHELVRLLEIEENRRAILAEALKEEKILIKLKEKKKEVFLEELKQEDIKFMDEIASNRFGKQEDLNINGSDE
jgi:flagellar FliJ protein